MLRPGGEAHLTLCSTGTWFFKDSVYPKIDENTVVKIDDGPEKGIPYFYGAVSYILDWMAAFNLRQIRHMDDCYFVGTTQNSNHYFILAGR